MRSVKYVETALGDEEVEEKKAGCVCLYHLHLPFCKMPLILFVIVRDGIVDDTLYTVLMGGGGMLVVLCMFV
jgi:hypothetical protein